MGRVVAGDRRGWKRFISLLLLKPWQLRSGLTGPYKTGIGTSALFLCRSNIGWILTCKVLDPMLTISAYSAIFPLSSTAI